MVNNYSINSLSKRLKGRVVKVGLVAILGLYGCGASSSATNSDGTVNQPPVIAGVVDVSGLIGSSLTLGGTCTDPEDGLYALTPLTYTPTLSTAVTVTRTCSDGNSSVTEDQTVTGTCGSNSPDGSGGCI